MGLADISLTSGMRSNLLSLQGTNNQINRTQDRLSTGKKVNTSLDNPTNFFASRAHLNRAGDLISRADSVKEVIQNIFAANAGATAISTLLQVANGVANAALGTSNLAERATLSRTFDELVSQVDTLASDSGYRGTNLLNGDSLTANFAEQFGVSTLVIAGVDATSTGLGVDKVNGSAVTIDVANVITAGTDYSLAINADGTVTAWGNTSNPGAQVPAGLTDVVSIKSGANFAVALKSDGTLVAWGTNNSSVVSGATGKTDIASISVGGTAASPFVLAVKNDGSVVAWGNNTSNVVTTANTLTDVTAVAAGTSFFTGVALKSDGSIVSWGSDAFDMVTGSVAVPLPTGTGYTAIANGGYQAAAITADSSVFVWGTDDAHGQKSDMPVGLTGVTQVAAGMDFTLALKSDGTVVGWGVGITSSYGGVDVGDLAIPAGLTGVVAISAGSNYAIALKDDGTVVGWGANATSGTIATQTGISTNGAWATNGEIHTSVDQLSTAITTMRSNSKALASNSAILTTRLDYISGMSNILQTGAANLTLADMNEEGANMLMLQTRQNLGINSLSMGSQAAQAVLRLF